MISDTVEVCERIKAIPQALQDLENGIRELHDRLVPVMIAPDASIDSEDNSNTCPVVCSIQIMLEIVDDIRERLQL